MEETMINTGEKQNKEDKFFMNAAIAEAKRAAKQDEVPVGAVVVFEGKIIARGHNLKETKNCAIYHAEIVALQKACKARGNWFLEGCSLYVTLEPCVMCVGAMLLSRIDRLVFGTSDPKTGACGGGLLDIISYEKHNHKIEVERGVEAEKCGTLLTNFFKMKRLEKKGNID